MDKAKLNFSYKLAIVTTFLAFIVVMLGAYTRLKDSGLGCPDWPGCYGHVTVPSVQQLVSENNQAAIMQPLEAPKAWAEMVHRYFAGSLSIAIMTLFFIGIYRAKTLKRGLILPIILLGLLIFQAILGMWTVTWLLYPLIVMAHLLGGMSIMALLWVYGLYCSGNFRAGQGVSKSLKTLAVISMLILLVQIILGGWTSSNYAALACPDFPFCNGKVIPALDFKEAFIAPLTFGPNYQGGLISMMARETIQFLHRFWAFITFFCLLGLAIAALTTRKTVLVVMGLSLLIMLLLQFALGVFNVLWQLPLAIAVAHNGVAALLLIAVASLNFALFTKGK